MSKCMVAYIDWYHERMDGEGGREKIKVNTNTKIQKYENTNIQIYKYTNIQIYKQFIKI